MSSTLSRRERLRAQTIAEIKEHALAQIAGGGTAALSLNAIAKAMGMSGPALYRYYSSREELLGDVVADGYRRVTEHLQQTAAAAAERTPADRLAALAAAYREWALEHPHQYAMLFGIRPASYADSAEAISEIQGAMDAVLDVLTDIAAGHATGTDSPAPLDRQLTRWIADRGGDAEIPPRLLQLGVLTWTRLHGIIGLELAGILTDMDLDATLLIEAELAAIVTAASGPAS
jgi:AcrR family transcriptional regulator